MVSHDLNAPIDQTQAACLAQRTWLREKFSELHARVREWDLTPMPHDWFPDD